MNLGDRIRAIRTAQNQSVRGQASLAGINHSTLLRWESGETRPTRYALISFLQASGFSGAEIEGFLTCYFDDSGCLTGSAIRVLRQQHRFTQAQLADLMRVKQSSISKWENGRAMPTPEQQASLGSLLTAPQDEALVSQFAALKQAIAGYDLAECFDSYQEFWRACATYPVALGDHWGRELTTRLETLASESADAKRLLAWLYASRAYGSLVRGNHREVTEFASNSIRLGNEIGFDLTTSYSFWIAARINFTKRTVTVSDQLRLKRLTMLAERKLGGTASPFASLVRSSYLLSTGNLGAARSVLSEIRADQFGGTDEGQCGGYGVEYWRDVLGSYHQMFALQARAYDDVLQCRTSESDSQPIPRLLAQAYNLAALTKVSKESLHRDYQDLESEADAMGLRFALHTMEDHIKRISNIDLRAKCLS